uniref:F-box domain-containing protein n=1 Tax=Strigamia maritima TaxID=126957 RepID=T1JF33_STRMM
MALSCYGQQVALYVFALSGRQQLLFVAVQLVDKMPYRNSLNLEEICLNKMISNFDVMQDQLANQPTIFIDTIFQLSCQAELYDLKSNIFIHSRTKSLHHLHLFELPMEQLIHQIGLVCKNLTYLKCVPVPSMGKLLQHLPQIQCLILRDAYRSRSDEDLVEICKHCPLLRKLDVQHWRITDKGLLSLNNCRKLEYLNVKFTDITSAGCFSILNKLPLLKVFKCKYTIDNNDLLFQLLETHFHSSVNETLRTYSIEKTPKRIKCIEDMTISTA